LVLMAGEAILLSGAKFPRGAPGGSTVIATDSVKEPPSHVSGLNFIINLW
jgi:hypothetical protein